MLLQHNSATSTLEAHMSTLKEIELQIESSNYKKDVHNKFQKLFPEAVYPPPDIKIGSADEYQRGIQVLEMNSLFSIFHRKSPGHGRDEDGAKNKAEALPQQPEPPMDTGAKQPTTLSALQPAFPHYAPGTGPVAHAQMVQANNIGMVGGAILGSATGGNPVMGMIEGQVGANMVMQRVQQEQKHLYYREQALRYRDGLPADGVGPAGGLALPSQSAGAGRDRSRSRSQRRDERRRKRWERRAKRRDGGGGVVGNEGSSGSDSD